MIKMFMQRVNKSKISQKLHLKRSFFGFNCNFPGKSKKNPKNKVKIVKKSCDSLHNGQSIY